MMEGGGGTIYTCIKIKNIINAIFHKRNHTCFTYEIILFIY